MNIFGFFLLAVAVQAAFWDSSEEVNQEGLVNTLVKATKVRTDPQADYSESLAQLEKLLEWILGVLVVGAICNVYAFLTAIVAEKVRKAAVVQRS